MKELLNKLQNIELDDKKMFAIALCAVVFLYLDISFLMKPQLNALKSISPKVAKVKTDLDNFNRDYALMSKLPAQAARDMRALNLKKVIEESDVVSLLQNISDIANKLDIKILQMRPNRDASGAKDKIPGMEKFTPMTIDLDLVSDYHKLGQFINTLEFGANFIAVQDMKISAQPTDFFKQKVSLVLKIYVKK